MYCICCRSSTLLNGFSGELDICRKNISEVKRVLEVVYSKTLGKAEKDIEADVTLKTEISDSLGKADAAFTSFTGTYKSIKASLDSQLLFVQRHPHVLPYIYNIYHSFNLNLLRNPKRQSRRQRPSMKQ